VPPRLVASIGFNVAGNSGSSAVVGGVWFRHLQRAPIRWEMEARRGDSSVGSSTGSTGKFWSVQLLVRRQRQKVDEFRRRADREKQFSRGVKFALGIALFAQL